MDLTIIDKMKQREPYILKKQKLDYCLVFLNEKTKLREHIASFQTIEDARSLIYVLKRLYKGWFKFEIYFNDKLIETL